MALTIADERPGADEQDDDQREQRAGERNVERDARERDEDRGLEQVDDDDRGEHGRDVRARRERRRAKALQHAGFPPDNEQERQPGECRRGRAVADHAGQQELVAADALDVLVAVGGGEHQIEDDREQEREERELPAPPEELLLGPELMEEKPHSDRSSVSVR
jgi:hypothetical protein